MINIRMNGSGPLLVLMHGFCESIPVWDPIVPALIKKFTVVTVDVPGFGSSEALRADDSMDRLASRLLESLQNFTPFTFCGHSMGGYLGLAILAQNPSAFLGLQLLHSTALADSEERKLTRNKTIQFIENQGKEAFLENFVPNLFHQKKPEFLSATLELCSQTPVLSLTGMTAIMRDRPDRMELLKSAQCPISWIGGKQDALIPWQSLLEQASLPADSHLALLDDCGHMGILEQPVRTAAAISSFAHYCQSLSSATL
jgi:pimeloyl-ACP methyl ester carboxylesterase